MRCRASSGSGRLGTVEPGGSVKNSCKTHKASTQWEPFLFPFLSFFFSLQRLTASDAVRIVFVVSCQPPFLPINAHPCLRSRRPCSSQLDADKSTCFPSAGGPGNISWITTACQINIEINSNGARPSVKAAHIEML